jgi:hypothetical protein
MEVVDHIVEVTKRMSRIFLTANNIRHEHTNGIELSMRLGKIYKSRSTETTGVNILSPCRYPRGKFVPESNRHWDSSLVDVGGREPGSLMLGGDDRGRMESSTPGLECYLRRVRHRSGRWVKYSGICAVKEHTLARSHFGVFRPDMRYHTHAISRHSEVSR